MDDSAVIALRDAARDMRLTIELGTIGTDADELRAWLRVARVLGSKVLRTIIVDPTPNLTQERRALEQVLPEYESAGVAIAVESHERVSVYALKGLITDITSPSLGVCLDSVNSLGRGEGIREVTDLLAPHVLCVHLKDFRAVRGETDMGFRIEGAELGTGGLDYRYVLERVYEHNPVVSVILEQWTELSASVEATIGLQWEWAQTGVETMKKAIRELEERAGSG